VNQCSKFDCIYHPSKGGITNCSNCLSTFGTYIKYRASKYKEGQKVILKRAVSHGDWKTASVFPDRYPTLEKGTEVEVVKVWSNFYGTQVRVKEPNGRIYDIEENRL
jgi:hypothetical protein